MFSIDEKCRCCAEVHSWKYTCIRGKAKYKNSCIFWRNFVSFDEDELGRGVSIIAVWFMRCGAILTYIVLLHQAQTTTAISIDTVSIIAFLIWNYKTITTHSITFFISQWVSLNATTSVVGRYKIEVSCIAASGTLNLIFKDSCEASRNVNALPTCP